MFLGYKYIAHIYVQYKTKSPALQCISRGFLSYPCNMRNGWISRQALYKGVLLIVCFTLLVAAIRGCRLAVAPSPSLSDQDDLTLTVYLHQQDETVEMGLDEYLYGVLGGEMPASFPLEALKAQAVAARTYTVRRMASLGGDPCGRGGADVCTDSSCCQSYRSPQALAESWGSQAKQYEDKLRQAVADTHGLIAVYDDQPIEALYHSAAGGHTEDAQNVFSNALPYLVGVESPGEQDAAHYLETVSFSVKELASTINQAYPKANLSPSKLESQMEIMDRYESGQVETLRLGDTTVSGKEFRKALDLRSANFSLAFSQDTVSITTCGYGHGVGMSQYGARAMALEGADFQQILSHYYTGIQLKGI